MDQELIAYLDQRFRENAQQVQNLSQQTQSLSQQLETLSQSVDEHFREISQQIQELRENDRHIMVVVEGLNDKVDTLAEVVAAHDEKTERRFKTLRSELGQEIADTRSLLKQSYSDLDRRVKRLESKAS